MTLNNDPTLTPATDQGALATGAEAGAKRQQQQGKPDFGTRFARQAATLAWTGAEVAAELRENTAALRDQNAALTVIAESSARQADAAERSAVAAERSARLTHMQTMLALYNTPEQVLPEGVLEQLKAQVGITTKRARVPAAAPTPAPSAAPAQPALVTVPARADDFDEFV